MRRMVPPYHSGLSYLFLFIYSSVGYKIIARVGTRLELSREILENKNDTSSTKVFIF